MAHTLTVTNLEHPGTGSVEREVKMFELAFECVLLLRVGKSIRSR